MEPKNTVESKITKGDVRYAYIVAFFAWVFCVYDYILFGTLLPLIAEEFNWTVAFSTQIVLWVNVTTLIFAVLVGPITDYYGRRNALLITTAGAAVSSGLAGFAPGAIYLILVRSISGLGFSEQGVNTTYLSELSDAKKRGFMYSFVQGGWPIGVLLASFSTLVFLPLVGWRGVFFIGVIPAIIIVILRLKLKESPRFEEIKRIRQLIKEGKIEEAKRIGQEKGIDSEKLNHFSIAQLFASDIRRHTIFFSLAAIFNWFAILIFIVLGTTVLTGGKGLTIENSLILLVVSNVVAYIGYVVHGFIGDKIGRRETMMGAWILASLLFTYMLFVSEGFWPVLVSYSIGLFFLAGSFAPLITYSGESFPTRIRGTGSTWIIAMGLIGGVFGSLLFSSIVDSSGVLMATFITGVIPLFISAFILLGARRIAPSLELEEIAQ